MRHFSKVRSSRPLVLLNLLSMACACQGQPTSLTVELPPSGPSLTVHGEELSWPRQFEDSGTRVSIFKPQSPNHNVTESSASRVNAYDGNFHARVQTAPAASTARSAPVTTLAPGVTYNPNLYGGRDSSVYRQSPSVGWERNTGSTWQSVPRAQAPALEQQAVTHSMTEQRFNDFRSVGGGFSHPAGSVVHSGGGGHR